MSCAQKDGPDIAVVPEPASEYRQWHTVTIDFVGPDTSETAIQNPFTDYLLIVTFTHNDVIYKVRGFYAADGDAGQTGTDNGNIWRVRFTPDRTGTWSYDAALRVGARVALSDDEHTGDVVPITDSRGKFRVVSSDKSGADFRAHGKIIADGSYFRFDGDGAFWLKGGANSPENLLGYADFDGTYRIAKSDRDGEASASETLHNFDPHIRDWREGDPVWRGSKGKGLIGAVNYLAQQGMNAVYFLVLNIGGDGNDVWPYRDPLDFTRFDVSKLAQWEIVFSHMQSRGILLHIVTQETENELLHDDGDVGPERRLFYHEMIARFGHHPGLVWNLGEENGPVHWRPAGQNDSQRRAMAAFFEAEDPYGHPVFLHTHSEAGDKDIILSPLLGNTLLDGLSMQIADRTTVYGEFRKWRELSVEAERPWILTMDEIGMWHTGAMADVDDPAHDGLRHHVLWGGLFAGGAGVEWYFGAHQDDNDLTTEDWRSRANLWTQTRNALLFFDDYLPYWAMAPCQMVENEAYCFGKPGEVYAVYAVAGATPSIDLTGDIGSFSLQWFDPVEGGGLQLGGIKSLPGGSVHRLGQPPDSERDWVALLRRQG